MSRALPVFQAVVPQGSTVKYWLLNSPFSSFSREHAQYPPTPPMMVKIDFQLYRIQSQGEDSLWTWL